MLFTSSKYTWPEGLVDSLAICLEPQVSALRDLLSVFEALPSWESADFLSRPRPTPGELPRLTLASVCHVDGHGRAFCRPFELLSSVASRFKHTAGEVSQERGVLFQGVQVRFSEGQRAGPI